MKRKKRRTQNLKHRTKNYKFQTIMCNCGNKRIMLNQQQSAVTSNTPKTGLNIGDRNFEYTGKTALTVIGNVTGKNYRFDHPGAIQAVDLRDVPGMRMVPILKRL